jgi:hypothetical protein
VAGRDLGYVQTGSVLGRLKWAVVVEVVGIEVVETKL